MPITRLRSRQCADPPAASCRRHIHPRARRRHQIPIAPVAPPVPNFPRLRALALFGRRPPQRVEGFLIPASKNLHINGNASFRGTPRRDCERSVPPLLQQLNGRHAKTQVVNFIQTRAGVARSIQPAMRCAVRNHDDAIDCHRLDLCRTQQGSWRRRPSQGIRDDVQRPSEPGVTMWRRKGRLKR